MNNDTPVISVIVPVYKVEAYLNKCVDSILNQTYKNLEIILVDDGSPDNCPKICDDYALKDKRIKVIHKKNGGLSDARNCGIREATGEFIGFIDSDDYIEDNMFEYLYMLIDNYKADISICGLKLVYDDKPSRNKCCDSIKSYNSIDALKELSKNEFITNHACNKLFKKCLFIDNQISYPCGKILEDIETTYKLFEVSNLIVVGDKCCYNYVQRTDSIMGKRDAIVFQRLFESSWNRYDHFKNDNELSFYFYKNAFYELMRAYIDGDENTIKLFDMNSYFNEVIKVGKENGEYKKLSLSDKIRVHILKLNKQLYRNLMLNRRRVLNRND